MFIVSPLPSTINFLFFPLLNGLTRLHMLDHANMLNNDSTSRIKKKYLVPSRRAFQA